MVCGWLDLNNNSLISSIKSTVSVKDLNLSLHKVKGHSNNYYNDIADDLAKNAKRNVRISQLGLIDPPTFINNGLPYMLSWNGHPLDRNIRHFTKNLTNTVEATS